MLASQLCRRPLRLILLSYLMLAVLYSVATPIFEASDEVSHYAVIQHIVDNGDLPIQHPGVRTAWEQEGSQPPLYYLLMSAITRTFDTRDAAERMQPNPHTAPGDPSLDANRNLVVHSAGEDFPWHGTALAVHVLRLISIGLGMITIGCGYALARRLFPDRASIPSGTAALIAFNPMFLFIAASVNNDNLVVALSSLALYLAVACWQEATLDRAAWFRRVGLGVVLGAAALTKISGLTLLPVIGLMLTIRHLRGHEWRVWLFTGALLIGLVVAIAGWWYSRNVQLYGDVLGLNTMVAIAGPRSMMLLDLIPEFDGFRYSYWALFGAVNIVTWSVAYAMFDAFAALALIGFVSWLLQARRSEPRDRWWLMIILALYGLLVFVGVIRWTMMTPASQGRLMFSAIAAISLILWLGWETMLDIGRQMMGDGRWTARLWSGVKWAMIGLLLIVAALSPIAYIAPVYARPESITALPRETQRLDVNFGDEFRLLGYAIDPKSGEDHTARFTLYWECLRQPRVDYSVFIIAYGHALQEIGKRDAYPQRGLFGTRQCQPGQIIVDPYRLRLDSTARRPTIVRLQVGLKDWQARSELRPTANGQPLSSVIIIGGKLAPGDADRSAQVTVRYRVGDSIELTGYDLPQLDRERREITYRLYWHVRADLAGQLADYTVFAHVLDRAGRQIGQKDGPPLNGDYPTSMWASGEAIVEERTIALDQTALPDAAEIALGLYMSGDGARLPVLDAAGRRVPNDAIRLPITQ